MRSTLIIVIVSIILILLPVWLLAPPLMTGPVAGFSDARIMRVLSEPAQAGRMAFGAQCAGCHGALAEGGDAPGLLTRDYAVDFRDAPAFHRAASGNIPAHESFMKRAKGYGRLGFNDLEMMAKFLRELRRHNRSEGSG